MTLLRNYWFHVLAVCVLALVVERIYNFGYITMERKHDLYVSERNATDAVKRNEHTERERKLEHTLQASVQDTEVAKQEQSRLRDLLVAAGSANDRLHGQLETIKSKLGDTSRYTNAAERGEAATRAAILLSDLLGSCGVRLIDLGGAVDQARHRGLQCEAKYEIVRTVLNKAP